MPSRSSIRERNKAIRKAWEREQQLVREGKGTRDWNRDQQNDILDPDKGKAYDEDGRAFEGQHMKSAAEYPDYRGNPDNIQFLTREEHLAAHKGSWQNPTNWYYNPETKEFVDFGDEGIIPCEVIPLSDPVIVLEDIEPEAEEPQQDSEKENAAEVEENSKTDPDNEKSSECSQETSSSISPDAANNVFSSVSKPVKRGGFIRLLKGVGKFAMAHPVETIEIAGVVIGGTAKIISSLSGRGTAGDGAHDTVTDKSTPASAKSEIVEKVSDIIETATRESPCENDVSGHKQRYHTRNGVEWRDKAPYHRGGKKDS